MPNLNLTEISVRALKGSGQYITYWDTNLPAFGVRVGKRRKTFVIVRGKKRERTTIGHYPTLSVGEARTKAKKLLGEEPKPKAVRILFEKARDEYLATFPESAHRYHLKLIFNKHFAVLEGKQLSAIEDSDVGAALDAIEGPSARLHAFRCIRAFFRWSIRPPRRYVRQNPMEGYEAPGSDTKGSRTLTDAELKAVWEAADSPTERVFRLMILWGTRNGETIAIQRAWITDGVLVIPGEYTKNGRDHAIPILPQAKAILDSLPAWTTAKGETSPYFFPGRGGETHITPHSLAKLMRQIKAEKNLSGFTSRDIRRTFRTNMARLKVPRDLSEVLINHAPPVLDEIYDRYDRIREKRAALAKYEAFVLKLIRSGAT